MNWITVANQVLGTDFSITMSKFFYSAQRLVCIQWKNFYWLLFFTFPFHLSLWLRLPGDCHCHNHSTYQHCWFWIDNWKISTTKTFPDAITDQINLLGWHNTSQGWSTDNSTTNNSTLDIRSIIDSWVDGCIGNEKDKGRVVLWCCSGSSATGEL